VSCFETHQQADRAAAHGRGGSCLSAGGLPGLWPGSSRQHERWVQMAEL